MKTGLILSDMHCGSYYGIMPDSINIIDPRTHEPLTFKANSAQRDMFKLWKEMCETVKPDFVLVNGDVADGPQRKSMGQTTITNNLKDQCEIAIKLLKMIDCDTFYFTLGSGYHSMDDRPLEQYVAERMNGVYGDDLIIECEQTRIHASHNVPVSASSWQYRCYSGDTECFTERGWIKHHDLTPNDAVSIYDPETSRILFEHPLDIFIKPYSGEMINFKNKTGTDILVTPNHKMWVRDYLGNWKTRLAVDCNGRIDTLMCAPVDGRSAPPNKSIPGATKDYNGHTPKHEETDINMLDWCEFVGYFLSEGGRQKDPSNSNHQLSISQMPGEIADKIDACLNKIPFLHTKYNSDDGAVRWMYNRKQLWEYMAKFGGGASEKKIPQEYKNLPAKYLNRMMFAMLDGDGSKDPRNDEYKCYYTSSMQLANDFQEIATLCGYPTRVTVHCEPRKENHHRMYRIYIKTRNIASIRPEIVDYSGDVVCLTTRTGLYLTRRPGCYPTIQGNTTPVARDLLLHKLNDSARSYGDIDVVIRSHAHYHVAVMFTHQLGLITPCWQTRTPFAVKRDIISPPDIGYIVLNIDGKQVDMKRRIVHIGKPSPVVTVKK